MCPVTWINVLAEAGLVLLLGTICGIAGVGAVLLVSTIYSIISTKVRQIIRGRRGVSVSKPRDE